MSKPVRKNRLVPIFLLVALPLIGGAYYLRTAPARAEQALRKATYTQLSEALKNDPSNPRVFYYFGLRNRDLGRTGPARASLARASELDPDSEDIALARAKIAEETGNSQETFATLTAFLKRHPESTNAHWALALFYAGQGDTAWSYKEALLVTQQRPKDVKAWRLTAAEALKLDVGAGNAAEVASRQAVALDPKDWRNQFALGEALVAEQRNKDAIPAYQAAADLAPREPKVLARLGTAQLKAALTPQEIQQATQSLTRAVQLDPTLPLAQASLGEALLRAGNYADAKKTLLQAERIAPAMLDIHQSLIKLYRTMHDSTGEEREARSIREENRYVQERDRLRAKQSQGSFDPARCLQIARLFAAHGEDNSAAVEYRKLLGWPGYDPIIRKEIAALAQKHHELAAATALPTLAPASTSSATDLSAVLHDADNLLESKQYAQTVDACQSILASHPDSALAWQTLGSAYRALGRNDAAFRAMNHALKLDPSLPQAQFILAAIYYDQGLHDESARRLQKLIQQPAPKAEYFNALGDCQRDDEITYVQAESNYRRAVELAPAQWDYVVNLADMETRNHKLSEAETHYRQALQIAPNSPIAQMSLARFLLQEQTTPAREAEAERLLRGTLAQNPKSETASVYLGQLLVRRGQAKEAIPLLENAVLVAPRHKEPWYNLARAYDILHNKERSQFCYSAFRRVSRYIDDVAVALETTRTQPKNTAARLKLARLYGEGSYNDKAINQYQIYLSMVPGDKKVKQEMDDYMARLKATGKMPDMGFFNEMVTSSVKFH